MSEIAIIGMSCVYPGAGNLVEFWRNIRNKVDAVSDPPEEWEAELFFEEGSDANDRTYCKRGGYLGKLATFDPFAFGVLPNAIDGTEPDHFLALRAAHEALLDAGYQDGDPRKERTAVIIGRGSYVNRGNTTAIQHGIVVDSVIRVLRQLHPEHSEAELAEIKTRLKESLPGFHAGTAAGLVPNIISGRIANRLDLMGPNYIIDAACASSLVAVDLAVRDLETGRCDMAIAGGVHASTPPVILMIFSHLKALSKTGQIRPFDKDADGTLLGEGVGMAVLKRLPDAERDGDRIYAVLKGVGTASDGRALGLLAPRIEGEELALRRAYTAAGVSPATVGLVEAHGTGTPVGDAVEVQALDHVFGEQPGGVRKAALGSVKSMISHTMPASGMAGLIKAALSLHEKVLPPTLHCENPNPKLDWTKSRFYLNTETRPWIHGQTAFPRRAGVNAFGFGGINAHAVLEEYCGPHAAPSLQHEWDSELFVVSGGSAAEVAEKAAALSAFVKTNEAVNLKDLAWTLNCSAPPGAARLAIVARASGDLATKLDRAIPKLRDGKTTRIRDIEGIYYFAQPLATNGGKVGLIFPGEGAQYTNMLADLAQHFPEVRETFDLMDRAFLDHPRGYLPSEVIFPNPGDAAAAARLFSMDSGAESVFCANQALHALMEKLALKPDAITGHSTGEHTALLASGTVVTRNEEELVAHIRGVNGIFEELNHDDRIPQAQLLAIAGVDRRFLDAQVAASEGQLHLALDNCNNQAVLCGSEAAVNALLEALKGKAAITQKLPFARAYHTPWFEVFSEPLRRYFDRVRIGKPHTPLYSCVTAALYPEDPDAMRELTSVQWARTVRFRETVEAMYAAGVRIFVEAGPRGNLTAFVDDVLRKQPHIAIAVNSHSRSGIEQLQHAAGQLVAHGVSLRLEHLYERRAPKTVSFEAAPAVKSRAPYHLVSGLQPVRLPAGFQLAAKPAPAAARPEPDQPSADPRVGILEQHMRTMEQFLTMQQQVMADYLGTLAAAHERPYGCPFLTEVAEVVEGERAVVRHTFSLDRDLLFRDHTLGRDVSAADPGLSGQPVVPFTVTMEILAEAAALLAPGDVLTGMRDVRGSRWITLGEEKPLTVELTATLRAPGEIHVVLREAGGEALRPIWAEGIMLFAAAYPAAPVPLPARLSGERASAWTPEALYREGMFHGPLFQTVRSIEAVAPQGVRATLRALPFEGMFADMDAAFFTHPVLLDGAGQVVAFWSQEVLAPKSDIFPYRLGELRCFAPPPETGVEVECRVVCTALEAGRMASDIDLVGNDGTLYYRLKDWEDRRFPQPEAFWDLRIDPRQAFLSEAWPEPVQAFAEGDRHAISCMRVNAFTPELLAASHGIWLKTLAGLVLSRREREIFAGMDKAVAKRRHEWLLGRVAAKDAVRRLLLTHFGEAIAPADVEILADAHGRPVVEGQWREQWNLRPVVSIAHSAQTAVALAALDSEKLVGIDIESVSRARDGFERVAFLESEREMLAGLAAEQRAEWFLRFWCAKEAVSKAFGRGLTRGLHTIEVTSADLFSGRIRMELRDGLLEEFPQMRGRAVYAFTTRREDFISCAVIHHQTETTE